MKKTLLLISVLLFVFVADSYSACVDKGGGVWETDGNEAADVAECIVSASAGDTINVIAGNLTISNED